MHRGRRPRSDGSDDVNWGGAGRAVWRDVSGDDGFIVVFVLMLLAQFLLQAADDLPIGSAIAVTTTIAATTLAMYRARAPRGWYRAGLVLGVIVVAVTAIHEINDSSGNEIGAAAAGAFTVFLMFTLPAVLGAAFGHRLVSLNTVAATLTAFLLIGMLFASLYRTVALVDDDAFFNQAVDPTLSEMTYFSFVTVTTLGYGDLTPATSIGRGLATLEAVIGQVFLVTAVALTVSRLGSKRRTVQQMEALAHDDGDERAPPDDPGDGPTSG